VSVNQGVKDEDDEMSIRTARGMYMSEETVLAASLDFGRGGVGLGGGYDARWDQLQTQACQ